MTAGPTRRRAVVAVPLHLFTENGLAPIDLTRDYSRRKGKNPAEVWITSLLREITPGRESLTGVYDGLISELYDDYTAADSRNDFPFWRNFVQVQGGLALELGCGTGRLLLPLLEAGCQVWGVDNSRDMLARCRREAKLRKLNPHLLLGDLTECRPGPLFGSIFCAAGTLTLLIQPGQMERALQTAQRNLEPGGRVGLSMDRPRTLNPAPIVARDLIRSIDGARLRCLLAPLPQSEPQTERWLMTNEVSRDGEVMKSDTRVIGFRRLEPDDFGSLIEEAGFHQVEFFDTNVLDEYVAVAVK